MTWNDVGLLPGGPGFELLSEAEWEKAARGIDHRQYPWGNEWTRHAAVQRGTVWDLRRPGSGREATPSGQSPYGCLDMAGNVDEWTESWYESIRSIALPVLTMVKLSFGAQQWLALYQPRRLPYSVPQSSCARLS